MKLRKKLIDQMKKIWPTLPGIILLLLIKSCDKQDFCRKRVVGCPKMTQLLKCYAPSEFSGAKFQV